MERKADLPAPPPATSQSIPISAAADALTSSSFSSSSSASASPPDFLRHVHAAIKRHRPPGTMQSNFPRARRVLVPQTEPSKSTTTISSMTGNMSGKMLSLSGAVRTSNVACCQKKEGASGPAAATPPVNQEESSITPPSISGTITSTRDHNIKQLGSQKDDYELMFDREKSALGISSSQLAPPHVSVDVDFKKDKVFLSADAQLTFQSDNARLTSGSKMDGMSTYLHSLALTEGEGYLANRATHDQDRKQHGIESMEVSGRDEQIYDLHHAEPLTRCSAMGSSGVTTLSVHSAPTFQSTRAPQAPTQMSSCAVETSSGILDNVIPKEQGTAVRDVDWQQNNQQLLHMNEALKERAVAGSNASSLPSQIRSTSNPSSSLEQGSSQLNKADKAPRRKKFDPDVFFKVNGKLYQKLGKIGSGGSSEVHKVISSDCMIYALKKIKLKGRDYPTAYGFCQEIEYLNKLKGKSNIIQLIDYEVTDKSLLQEGSMKIKDGRIKDDHHIYMVLEYGEIDLAHMVAQKLKETSNPSLQIDENWLRFYWQQMLEAVKTIHEERIVHSDLKPANFLLVRGSLKLIDFGIAKAILSDTTNIQRDSQVGTLNYMSPEAFMCNEHDANGSTIKCGRPSDIWSLGCILYQMVYGKTPFSEYKTFWAKFKVVTDRNYQIIYEPVSNPWLIDLMRRCLAWDRNERWRIPQLLQHPFLVPPIAREPSPDHPWKALLERVGVYWNNPDVSRLCSELHKVVAECEKAGRVSATDVEQSTL
ncbi:dual specificity protein kinase Ttk isoform X2 [Ananas comosus]|uniref:Dual specificity protein kinase Ttk isoform X2 n=1 Tax=Ananas comosus TaxID=4615 RepID=A0A199VXB4_ANACO|nr:dual specificity protein kinase Ttk isoform X2 [Ananas comosus]OAY81623.1 Serine/threonine-protein kinase mph1 [Ananas comosus]